MAIAPYTKPHLSIKEQIALLQQRGMTITDDARAADYLQRVGYYRLSEYWFQFRRTVTKQVGGATKVEVLEEFRPGTEFQHAVELYVFDKRLRLIMLDAVERIEVGVRVDLATFFGARNPWFHRDPWSLDGNFTRKTDSRTGNVPLTDWLQRVDAVADQSKEEFAVRYRSKYSSPFPIWIAIELWDFGLLSTFFAGLTKTDRAEISRKYGVERYNLLAGWLSSINHLRNICAHHSRLWNRSPTVQPPPPRRGELPHLDHLATDPYAQTRVYGIIAPMQFLLRTINPTTSWDRRLKDHIASLPNLPNTNVRQMGFPNGWSEQALWVKP